MAALAVYLPVLPAVVAWAIGMPPGSDWTPGWMIVIAAMSAFPVLIGIAITAFFSRRRKLLTVAALILSPPGCYIAYVLWAFLFTDWLHT
jgi:hypothetical protein